MKTILTAVIILGSISSFADIKVASGSGGVYVKWSEQQINVATKLEEIKADAKKAGLTERDLQQMLEESK